LRSVTRNSYDITVNERGNENYRLTVAGIGLREYDVLDLHHASREGKSRDYKILYKIENGRAFLRWLDQDGHLQIHLENSEW